MRRRDVLRVSALSFVSRTSVVEAVLTRRTEDERLAAEVGAQLRFL